MKHIHSVFSLVDEDQKDIIKFVGLTSQTIKKRVADIISNAKFTRKTNLDMWVLELILEGKKPHIILHFESEDRNEAAEYYRKLVNLNITEHILNHARGNTKSIITAPLLNNVLVGRTPSKNITSLQNYDRKIKRQLLKLDVLTNLPSTRPKGAKYNKPNMP